RPGRAGLASPDARDPRSGARFVSPAVLGTLVVGGLAALDATAVAQTLASQPLVTATLLGVLWGDWATALAVGIVLQILAASTLVEVQWAAVAVAFALGLAVTGVWLALAHWGASYVERESLRLAGAWHLLQPLWLGFGLAQLLHAFVQRRLERAGVFAAALVG